MSDMVEQPKGCLDFLVLGSYSFLEEGCHSCHVLKPFGWEWVPIQVSLVSGGLGLSGHSNDFKLLSGLGGNSGISVSLDFILEVFNFFISI